MDLAVERARAAFEREVADPLGESVPEAALATVRVANASIARQIRRVTVERGHDPAAFALVAFGGAGPLQAAAVAREVGTDVAVVPPDPGVFSARGLLVADVRLDESRSYRGGLAADPLASAFAGLEERLRDRLRDQGFDPDEARVDRSADLRYEGQSYELTVDVAGDLDPDGVLAARERFHAAHERRYGHAMRDEPVEAVTLRAGATIPTPDPGDEKRGGDRAPHRGSREVYLDGEFREADVYRRTALAPGTDVEGPAVIEESGSTTLVPGDASARVSEVGSVAISW
jgi:N-methylhydantoinase A